MLSVVFNLGFQVGVFVLLLCLRMHNWNFDLDVVVLELEVDVVEVVHFEIFANGSLLENLELQERNEMWLHF